MMQMHWWVNSFRLKTWNFIRAHLQSIFAQIETKLEQMPNAHASNRIGTELKQNWNKWKCACANVHKSSIFIVLIDMQVFASVTSRSPGIAPVVYSFILLFSWRRRVRRAIRRRRPRSGQEDSAAMRLERGLVGERDLPTVPIGAASLTGLTPVLPMGILARLACAGTINL